MNNKSCLPLQTAQAALLEQLAGQSHARRGAARSAADVVAAQARTSKAEAELEALRDSLARLAQEIAETEVRNCVEAKMSRIIASLSGRVETALEALRDILARLAQEIAETEVFDSTSRRTWSENLAPLFASGCRRGCGYLMMQFEKSPRRGCGTALSDFQAAKHNEYVAAYSCILLVRVLSVQTAAAPEHSASSTWHTMPCPRADNSMRL